MSPETAELSTQSGHLAGCHLFSSHSVRAFTE
jgi:hypothetical protein